ncbi:MAG: M23 family metallopeptidase [Alphaproteobacteria bacterium]|nr:M23 family metallopeptidase [Alphaproteobacteria bacterium]MBN2674892.1 M23 family metallopeptidase [Alphaproteobacteria bacterium]
MKYKQGIFFLLMVYLPIVANAAVLSGQENTNNSFLSAQTFPKTVNDLSFTERVELLKDGYAPWESEYDNNGNCVSNCAYVGITIEKELDVLQRNTEIANIRVQDYKIKYQPAQILGKVRCYQSNNAIPSNQTIPFGEPLIGNPNIVSGYGKRIHPITKKLEVHKGIDFSVPNDTNIYSPARGIVDTVWTDSTCGNGLRIQHEKGFSTLYCHLDKSLVKKGDLIEPGCLIAKSGNTGRSTGPHLHYGIYLDKNLIDPTGFINQ